MQRKAEARQARITRASEEFEENTAALRDAIEWTEKTIFRGSAVFRAASDGLLVAVFSLRRDDLKEDHTQDARAEAERMQRANVDDVMHGIG